MVLKVEIQAMHCRLRAERDPLRPSLILGSFFIKPKISPPLPLSSLFQFGNFYSASEDI